MLRLRALLPVRARLNVELGAGVVATADLSAVVLARIAMMQTTC